MKPKILSNAEIIGLSLFFPKEKILVFTDLHLGYEEALIKQGTMIPKFNFDDTIKRIKKILAKTKKLNKIIILGDLKHELGSLSQQEWKEVTELISFLKKNCREIILLKGNHDNFLEQVVQTKNLTLKDSFFLEKQKILFVHGDKVKLNKEFSSAETIVIGHEHPAVILREGIKTEKFKCFLKGKYCKKNLIVLPSFISTNEGTDVLTEKLLSPFLQQDLSEFEAWIIADKIYFFGKLKELELEKTFK